MKALFVAVCVLALAVAALAAERSADWQSLAQLRRGQKIEVVQTNMAKYSGKFVSLADEAITMTVDGTVRSIPREQVARVSTGRAGARVAAAVALGFGGALAGAGVAHVAAGRTHDVGVDVLGAMVGAAIGTAGGAYAVPRRTLYRPAK